MSLRRDAFRVTRTGERQELPVRSLIKRPQEKGGLIVTVAPRSSPSKVCRQEADIQTKSTEDDEMGESMNALYGVWKVGVASLAVLALPVLLTAQIHHYEYVFQDGHIYVYDIDNSFSLVKSVQIPTQAGTRGSVASAVTGMLYISYGPDANTGGSMLKYDLTKDQVVWTKTYSFGIDSMSLSPDGKKIYMPTGENNPGGLWEVIDAVSGNVVGSINSGGVGPHNTLLNASGTHVYMAPRGTNYLVEADASTYGILHKIGPITTSSGPGVRPFTINGSETLAFMTATGLLGFQVGDIATGKILYKVPIQGFSWNGTGVSCPSHGVSMSPNEKELYVIDAPNSYVHVYDVTGLPAAAPKQVANIPLAGKMTGTETACAYDCTKGGWLHHSRDGRYVFVGDSGDVIDTATRTTVGRIPTLANSKKSIEIDFQNGAPVWAMGDRQSRGGASSPPPPPAGGIGQVQSSAVEGSSVSSLSRAFPAGNTAGNLIVALVRMSTTTQTVRVTDSAGNPYTQAVSQVQSADGHQLQIFYARNVIGGANTVKATFSGTNAHPWLAIYEYKGLSATSPVDQTAAAQGSGTTPNTGASSTTRAANELVFVGTGLPANTVTATAGAGYTMGLQDTTTARAATESKVVSSTGSYTGTFTLSGTSNWSAVLATFAAEAAPVVTTTSLPQGVQKASYSATLSAAGGAAPYTWTLRSGALPAGLSLATTSGVVSGTPTTTGTSNFTVQLKDANAQTATRALSITINAVAGSGISLNQSYAVQGSAAVSLSAAFPASNTAGNLIIAFVRMSTSTQTVTMSDAAGNVYVDAVSKVQTADGSQVHILYAKNVAGGANTVRAAFSSTNAHPWLAIYEFSNLSKTAPLDQVASAQGSSSSASTGPTRATTSANELLFVGTGLPSSFSGSASAGSGYTLRQQNTSTSRASTETAVVSAMGSYTGTTTLSVTANWSAVIATFRQ